MAKIQGFTPGLLNSEHKGGSTRAHRSTTRVCSRMPTWPGASSTKMEAASGGSIPPATSPVCSTSCIKHEPYSTIHTVQMTGVCTSELGRWRSTRLLYADYADVRTTMTPYRRKGGFYLVDQYGSATAKVTSLHERAKDFVFKHILSVLDAGKAVAKPASKQQPKNRDSKCVGG